MALQKEWWLFHSFRGVSFQDRVNRMSITRQDANFKLRVEDHSKKSCLPYGSSKIHSFTLLKSTSFVSLYRNILSLYYLLKSWPNDNKKFSKSNISNSKLVVPAVGPTHCCHFQTVLDLSFATSQPRLENYESHQCLNKKKMAYLFHSLFFLQKCVDLIKTKQLYERCLIYLKAWRKCWLWLKHLFLRMSLLLTFGRPCRQRRFVYQQKKGLKEYG